MNCGRGLMVKLVDLCRAVRAKSKVEVDCSATNVPELTAKFTDLEIVQLAAKVPPFSRQGLNVFHVSQPTL